MYQVLKSLVHQALIDYVNAQFLNFICKNSKRSDAQPDVKPPNKKWHKHRQTHEPSFIHFLLGGFIPPAKKEHIKFKNHAQTSTYQIGHQHWQLFIHATTLATS